VKNAVKDEGKREYSYLDQQRGGRKEIGEGTKLKEGVRTVLHKTKIQERLKSYGSACINEKVLRKKPWGGLRS